ncbi:intraflagellar transport protein 80 homolog [Polyergus mexicanus]|uniref:intraflagellar transport protein 80 homolog n=1 Tax=Polyergus mexicanus TaxID=615972 RepID=UPI0038B4473F
MKKRVTMRFKVSLHDNNIHKRLVACVAWNSTDEIYSCGEDHLLVCWHLENGTAHPTVVTEFSNDFYPTDMQWHPHPNHTSIAKKSSLDVLLITTADGKYHLVNKNGRIEKSINAHMGATIVGRWSNDGSALLTAGEDGLIKIWSRSGMLRSTLIKANLPILTSSWSPDCSTILYSQGANLILQSFNSNSKSHKWHAHDSLILIACWKNNLILSGSEDCRYKVWDVNNNQLLYSSGIGDYPVTAISWCSSGNYFAVGSFNTIKLCDKNGWLHSMEKVNTGSIYSIAWSSDGTQVAMACGNGKLLTGHIIDRAYMKKASWKLNLRERYFPTFLQVYTLRRLEWDNYEAMLIKRKVIEVKEVGNEVHEVLEISDRVVHLEFGFGHLVVITPAQCHIYSVTNWNTPAIFNLKRSIISAVFLAERHFLIVEFSTMSLYNYQGRLLGTPRWKGFTDEPLYTPCLSLCADTLVIRNETNKKCSEFGKQPSIVSVRNGMVMVRRGDGATVATSFYNLFKHLYEHTSNKRLKEALSICRIAQNEILWTCMAVIATDNKDLHAAEEAYAAIGRFDIVDYIKYIKSLPNTTEKCAEMALLAGDLLAAEGILLQSGLIKQAIHINLEVYNWNRALELAIRHKRQLEEVLNARAKYLHIINKNETNQNFLTHIENISTPQLANKENNEKKIYAKNNVEQTDVK